MFSSLEAHKLSYFIAANDVYCTVYVSIDISFHASQESLIRQTPFHRALPLEDYFKSAVIKLCQPLC